MGRGVIGREVHVAQGICNLLIHFGPRVEVEQRGDDLGIDLAAVVVAGQGRGDGRGHRAAGGVVGQLAGHEARHLPLVPVGHQLAGDEGQHLRLGPVLGQVEGVDGSCDRCARLQLRVGFAVYAVRTVASCPAEMPCNSITGGSVTPSSRIRPVRVDGKSDILH